MSSPSFSSDLVRGVHVRECGAAKPRDARNEEGSRRRIVVPLPSRVFSHARGHLRVSDVLLDGPIEKRDSS